MGAVVQANDHVGSISHLELDALLGCELVFALRAFRLKSQPLGTHAAKLRVLADEGIGLEPA